MAKVRVPKNKRPPTRHGKLIGTASWALGEYKVAGAYRPPKAGEYFWDCYYEKVTSAVFSFTNPFVILEKVK